MLVRAKKEVRSMTEKACMLVGKCMLKLLVRAQGNEEHYFENLRKGDSCYVVAENLAELYSAWLYGR